MKFRVLRPHDGDQFYNIGDVREANEADVKHLVPLTLQPIAEKAETATANKAAPAVKNKKA
jgi:hypothetical protein